MKNRLLNLLVSNRGRAPAVLNAKKGDDATVYLYGPIVSSAIEAEWFGGTAAEAFVPELAKLEAKTIHLRIDSPGGDTFGAQAIRQALLEHPARVVAHVDGLAASAATIIAGAADETVMAEGAMFMVHRAWTIAYGNANDFTSLVALLGEVDGVIAAQYAQKTGKSVEDVLAMMDKETWMTAQAAVDNGFADSVYVPPKKVESRWDLSVYGIAAPEPIEQPTERFASAEKRAWQNRQLRLPAL